MTGLKGKRVVISGGCGDIGSAVAARFLDEGARVLVSDRLPDDTGAARVAERLGNRAKYVYCDVSDYNSVQQAMQRAVELLGGIDVSISNAGVVANRPFLEVTPDDFNRTLAVNLLGSVWFAQAAARQMLKNPPQPKTGKRGVVLFTGSWVQSMPWPEGSSYCASKAAQEMVMKVAAQELASEGITVNVVSPGIVYAGLTKGIYDSDERYRQRADHTIPQGRLCSAEELAGTFAFLASDDAAYITGTTVTVDGGASLVRR
jgi:NAD(P)-dependent dehydrogenase (short-subunit alcohol dehydrogenase family)